MVNRLLLPLILLPLWVKLAHHVYGLGGGPSESRSLLLLFSVCIALLAFFTVLISGMLKRGHKSAPELMARTLTFWWMLALFLISVTTHLAVTVGVIGVFSALAVYEYLSFARAAPHVCVVSSPMLAFCVALVPVNLVLHYQGLSQLSLVLISLVAVLVIPSLLVLENNTDSALVRYGYVVSGLFFFVFSFGYAAALARQATLVLLFCFFLTEIRDLGSYWMGKFFARAQQRSPEQRWLTLINYKIAANVSPNKSWGVGLLSCLLLMAIALSLRPLLPAFKQGLVGPEFMLVWALLIGILGLMGDLVFSMFKRQFGLKDSGHLLPGATGIIDRIDSLVLTLPATYFLFYYTYF
ncbi:phosphatidate cytidylyltransferase [bacterium]|nr:phosphatidate cytidylyltransferase [bacterium]